MVHKSDKTESVPKQITLYLIDKYGERLGFDEKSFPDFCDFNDHLSALGARNIITNETVKFTKKTSQAMCEIFAPALPRIKAFWFLKTTPDAFKVRCELPDNGEDISAFPRMSISLNHGGDINYQTLKKEVYDQLVGRNFVTYRYAFEDTGVIAKELLSFYDNDGEIRFSYFFRVSGDPTMFVREFKGGVVFINENILLVGVYTNLQNKKSRMRTLILKSESVDRDDNIDFKTKYDHRIGILSSGLPNFSHGHFSEPATSIVYLERIPAKGLLTRERINEHVNLVPKGNTTFHARANKILGLISNQPSRFVLHTDTDEMNTILA